MTYLIDKSALVAEIKRRIKEHHYGYLVCLKDILSFIDTLEVKESDEAAKAFARIIRANLTGIDKDVQYKFEQLYKEITGEKMYQGYND